jgi:ribosomal protein L32
MAVHFLLRNTGEKGITVIDTKPCPSCGYDLPLKGRFCPKCGTRADRKSEAEPPQEAMNIRILYIMVGLLILAVLFPPWQTPPDHTPEFLGFHFILSPPAEGAQRSPVLQMIQLFTIAVAGLYFSWAYRGKG